MSLSVISTQVFICEHGKEPSQGVALTELCSNLRLLALP
jgi:hypothetical protein